MNFDLAKQTILLTRAGSRAYGTNRPNSDVDVRGVCVVPSRVRNGFLNHFEQADGLAVQEGFKHFLSKEEQEIVNATKLDGCVYALPKFMALAAECNPNILDVLFVSEEDVLLETRAGALLRSNKREFLSKKALYTFSGYAKSQLKRIETHRRWLLNPPGKKPERVDFGLPPVPEIPTEQLNTALGAIRQKIDTWSVDFGDLDEAGKIHIQEQVAHYLGELEISREQEWRAAGILLGYGDDLLDLLRRERKYKDAFSDWEKYSTWQRGRNPARSALEAQHGYDTKHGMHLVRLLTMCREILTTRDVLVRRPDAQFLNDIRNGLWPYDRLMDWAKANNAELSAMAGTCTLPRAPDMGKLNDLCIALTEKVG